MENHQNFVMMVCCSNYIIVGIGHSKLRSNEGGNSCFKRVAKGLKNLNYQ